MTSGITSKDRNFLHMLVDLAVTSIRHDNPRLTPGEVYDALAEELERRCREVIERGH